MTSDSNNTLLAVVLVWLNYPYGFCLLLAFRGGKLATVSAGAQLVVLANDTGGSVLVEHNNVLGWINIL